MLGRWRRATEPQLLAPDELPLLASGNVFMQGPLLGQTARAQMAMATVHRIILGDGRPGRALQPSEVAMQATWAEVREVIATAGDVPAETGMLALTHQSPVPLLVFSFTSNANVPAGWEMVVPEGADSDWAEAVRRAGVRLVAEDD